MIGTFGEDAEMKFYVEITEMTEEMKDPWTETYWLQETGPMEVDLGDEDDENADIVINSSGTWLEEGIMERMKEAGEDIRTCEYRMYMEMNDDEDHEQIEIQRGIVYRKK